MAKLNKKNLMKLVVEVGGEVSLDHFNDEGDTITKDEALVRLLWKNALGFVETTIDDKGNEKQVVHKPNKWAVEMIAKARGIVAVDESSRPKKTAAKNVREMAKNRLNKLAAKKDDVDAE